MTLYELVNFCDTCDILIGDFTERVKIDDDDYICFTLNRDCISDKDMHNSTVTDYTGNVEDGVDIGFELNQYTIYHLIFCIADYYGAITSVCFRINTSEGKEKIYVLDQKDPRSPGTAMQITNKFCIDRKAIVKDYSIIRSGNGLISVYITI